MEVEIVENWLVGGMAVIMAVQTLVLVGIFTKLK